MNRIVSPGRVSRHFASKEVPPAQAHAIALIRRWLVAAFAVLIASTSVRAAQFTLTWADNSSNETGFRIERSTDGTSFAEIATVGANVVSYVDAGLPNSTTYSYRLCAYNTAGNSAYSNVATGTTPPPASNNAPTISNILNQTINVGTNTGALAFTVGDVETAAGSLTLSRASSNTTLVPTANIVFGGSGSSRTVTVTPAAGQTGSATITVTVSDGSLSANDTFVVTVNAVNTAPTISNISNRTINEDSNTGAVAFTIADAETAAGSLTLAATSSNTTVVPGSNIVFGGSGSSRTVTVTPAANQSGTSTITVTVSDGSLTASDSFVLTVAAVNDAPTISNIANRSINQDASTGAISFSVADVETSASSLTLSATSSNTTLVPVSGIVFGGSSGSRTVTVTPAAGQTGTATITVTVSDGSLSASDSFTLSVNSVNTAPTISDIANRSVAEDTSTGAIAFTVGDAQTAAGSLTLAVGSSNTSLVPVANIVLGGSAASRTVTVTPAANLSGTATITITVSDGSLTASDSFVLTVTAVNDAPTISSIANRTINQDTSTGSINFTVGDVETSASSLSVTATSSNSTLVPGTSIVFGGSGSARTVSVAPAAGQSGSATITVSVSDGTTTTSTSFVLTVASTSTAPVITSQPGAVTVVAGGSATFSVAATGNPSPTYQWLRNGAAISGATAASYSMASVQTADAGSYTVVVSNAAGSVTSSAATLIVTEGVSILSQPASQTIAKNTSATLTVTASGSGLTYQWYAGDAGDVAAPISGATSSSYTTPKLGSSKRYWVRVSGSGQSVNSATAVVTVLSSPRVGSGSVKRGNKILAEAPVLAAGVVTDGTFSVMIDENGVLQMLAIDASSGLVIDEGGVTLDAAGGFSFAAPGVGTVSGQVVGDTINASVVGTDITFAGAISPIDGGTQALAGWYNGVFVNSSNDELIILAGPDGSAFMLAYVDGVASGGLALMDTAGSISVTLSDGRILNVTINGAGRFVGSTTAGGRTEKLSGARAGEALVKRLVNTSVRAQVRQGDALMVAGFVVGGNGNKRVLVRAVGPTLTNFGVAGVLADPIVTLFRQGNATPIATNNDWSSATNAAEVASVSSAIGAFRLPVGSKDAALLVELAAGQYTAQVTGAGGTTGIALVEVYDADASSGTGTLSTQLANISMRGVAGNGDDLVIAGFVVTGDAPKQVLIRSVGPELARFGVSGVATDPVLTVFHRQGTEQVVIASNNDWGVDAAAVGVAGDQVGAFKLTPGSTSSAMVIWLEPGSYTAQASSNNGSSGVALVEVYEVQ